MLADHIIVLQPRQYLRSRWKETVNQLGSSTVRSLQQRSMPHWFSASCCLLCGFIVPRSADANFFISGCTLSVNRWKGWKWIMTHWFFWGKIFIWYVSSFRRMGWNVHMFDAFWSNRSLKRWSAWNPCMCKIQTTKQDESWQISMLMPFQVASPLELRNIVSNGNMQHLLPDF